MAREPQTPDEYIASLPEDRREAVKAVRTAVRDDLPAGFEEARRAGPAPRRRPAIPESAFRRRVRSSTDAASGQKRIT
jgi:hypothetical protein